ncbi:hypothetical protein [Cyanobacterium aponinum]|nr:hypothetical protein [Cyanobacterium aponinum]
MIELKSYRDLTVWQKSMDLVVICYLSINFSISQNRNLWFK